MNSKVVGLILLVVLIPMAGWWWAMNYASQDCFQISVAFGMPQDEVIEMHAVASMGMKLLEPPRFDPSTFKEFWQEWVDQHFDLRDASGTPVKVSFMQHTDIIPQNKIIGTPEGYLWAKLLRGADYTFDYVPKVKEPKRYRHTFTAPTDDTPVSRLVFEVPS